MCYLYDNVYMKALNARIISFNIAFINTVQLRNMSANYLLSSDKHNPQLTNLHYLDWQWIQPIGTETMLLLTYDWLSQT